MNQNLSLEEEENFDLERSHGGVIFFPPPIDRVVFFSKKKNEIVISSSDSCQRISVGPYRSSRSHKMFCSLSKISERSFCSCSSLDEGVLRLYSFEDLSRTFKFTEVIMLEDARTRLNNNRPKKASIIQPFCLSVVNTSENSLICVSGNDSCCQFNVVSLDEEKVLLTFENEIRGRGAWRVKPRDKNKIFPSKQYKGVYFVLSNGKLHIMDCSIPRKLDQNDDDSLTINRRMCTLLTDDEEIETVESYLNRHNLEVLVVGEFGFLYFLDLKVYIDLCEKQSFGSGRWSKKERHFDIKNGVNSAILHIHRFRKGRVVTSSQKKNNGKKDDGTNDDEDDEQNLNASSLLINRDMVYLCYSITRSLTSSSKKSSKTSKFGRGKAKKKENEVLNTTLCCIDTSKPGPNIDLKVLLSYDMLHDGEEKVTCDEVTLFQCSSSYHKNNNNNSNNNNSSNNSNNNVSTVSPTTSSSNRSEPDYEPLKIFLHTRMVKGKFVNDEWIRIVKVNGIKLEKSSEQIEMERKQAEKEDRMKREEELEKKIKILESEKEDCVQEKEKVLMSEKVNEIKWRKENEKLRKELLRKENMILMLQKVESLSSKENQNIINIKTKGEEDLEEEEEVGTTIRNTTITSNHSNSNNNNELSSSPSSDAEHENNNVMMMKLFIEIVDEKIDSLHGKLKLEINNAENRLKKFIIDSKEV